MTPNALDQLMDERLLAIIRTDDPDFAMAALEGLVAGGARVAEISLSPPGAIETLRRAVDRFGDALTLGAGTVRTPQQAGEAVAAGARFLVAPGFDPAVLAAAQEHGVPHLPGVLTPTEVDRALLAGVPALKLFPADRLGPGYVADLLGPFPGARLVATGGLDATNASAYLAAGCVAVAAAGSLIPAGAPAGVIAAGVRTFLQALDTPTSKDTHAD
jgi:2-dehydro-3-deoxyphosphogluconate aldolase/(4S)-4-hydroxy-2-oxoglutarate aldolase